MTDKRCCQAKRVWVKLVIHFAQKKDSRSCPLKSIFKSLLHCVVGRLGFALAVNQTPARFNGAVGLTAHVAAVAVRPAVKAHTDNVVKVTDLFNDIVIKLCLTLGSVLVAVKTVAIGQLAINVV